jgi:hypothetical protein
MDSLFSRRNLPVVLLNVSTILIVAIMLVVNQALAKPNQSSVATTFNSGVLSYQGSLMDSNGNRLTGTYEMTFRIYPIPSGGTHLWEEVRSGANAVPVQNGLFNVRLGSLKPIPVEVWEAPELFLGVKIGNDNEMTPREMITGVPYANRAGIASGLTANSITGDNIIDGSLTQIDAPTLIRSGEYQNEIIRSGNSVFTNGSDENGAIVISYPCFPNGVRSFLAINGHYDANHSIVVGNQVPGSCATTIIVSPATANPIRIQWIAIGN